MILISQCSRIDLGGKFQLGREADLTGKSESGELLTHWNDVGSSIIQLEVSWEKVRSQVTSVSWVFNRCSAP